MNPFAAEVSSFLTSTRGFRITPRLRALIHHEEMAAAWPLLQELEQLPGPQNWAIAKRFLSFAADLPNAWRQLDQKARRSVLRKRLSGIRAHTRNLEEMLAKRELDLLLWNDQLGTALSAHTNIDQLLNRHRTEPTDDQQVETLRRLMAGDRSVDLRVAVRAVRRVLRALQTYSDPTRIPLIVSIHPTKIGATEAQWTFYIRCLSWFLLGSTGQPHDRIVCAVVSALADKPIDLDTVRKDRKRLQAALRERGFPKDPPAASP